MRLSRSGRSIQAPAKYKENLEEKVRVEEKVMTEEDEEIAIISNSKRYSKIDIYWTVNDNSRKVHTQSNLGMP